MSAGAGKKPSESEPADSSHSVAGVGKLLVLANHRALALRSLVCSGSGVLPDGRDAGALHIDFVRGAGREIDQQVSTDRAAVIDPCDHRTSIPEVGHTHQRVQRQRTLRGGRSHRVDAIAARNASEALAIVESASDAGTDLHVLIRSLIGAFRNLLVARIDPALLERDLVAEDAERAARQAAALPQAFPASATG